MRTLKCNLQNQEGWLPPVPATHTHYGAAEQREGDRTISWKPGAATRHQGGRAELKQPARSPHVAAAPHRSTGPKELPMCQVGKKPCAKTMCLWHSGPTRAWPPAPQGTLRPTPAHSRLRRHSESKNAPGSSTSEWEGKERIIPLTSPAKC